MYQESSFHDTYYIGVGGALKPADTDNAEVDGVYSVKIDGEVFTVVTINVIANVEEGII